MWRSLGHTEEDTGGDGEEEGRRAGGRTSGGNINRAWCAAAYQGEGRGGTRECDCSVLDTVSSMGRVSSGS